MKQHSALRYATSLSQPTLSIEQGTMEKLAGQTQRNRQPFILIFTPQAKKRITN